MTRAHLGHVRALQATGLVRLSRRALKADALVDEWAAVDAIKADTEPPIRAAFARLQAAQRDAVLGALPTMFARSPEIKRGPDDAEHVRFGAQLLSFGAWRGWVGDVFGPVLADVLGTGWAAGVTRVGADLTFRMTPGAVEALREGVGLITDTTTETQRRVGRIVADAMDSGADVDAVARELAAAFAEWTPKRARLVARTESTRAFEAGQVEGFAEAGVERKRWLSERDGEVRPEHDAMDGEEVPVRSAFSNGLHYPSEPNCRCTVLPVTASKALTWREARDERMRATYRAKAPGAAYWGDVVQEIADAEGLAFETARKICHSRG